MTASTHIALDYSTSVATAAGSAVAAEPEAQLTVPVAVLLESLAKESGIGTLKLLREAQLAGVRPDFAALLDGRPCGWIELKAPGHSLNGHAWQGREKRQWALLSELDALVVCNGEAAVLYRTGEVVATASLPYTTHEGWDPAPLTGLLRLFTSSRPAIITRPSQLAERLAPLARMLRDRISVGLVKATRSRPVQSAKTAWASHIHEHVTDKEFADDLAQVIAYSLAIAALRGGADADGDSLITLAEARTSLQNSNEVLAAALGPALQIPGLAEALAPEIGAIERLVSAVDAEKVAKSYDARGEPWLWFYEDFLAAYDPDARKAAGVYYTPTDVVRLQVRLVDHILRHDLSRKLGYGEKSVVTLDPATGSGTYPLAVIDQAAAVATAQRGAAGPAQIAPTLAKNLIAFETLPGPYAVAHLRIGQRLAELANQLLPPGHVRVYLTDTLDDPASAPQVLPLWGDVAVLAKERERAREVKSTQPVTVILGNPPYKRRDAESGGGWVLHPSSGAPLFDDVTGPPKTHNVIFSAQASLYNDYVYFWRWALHKAFEQDPASPAVVSFITASSWLTGPAFLGLRQLARKLADEMWIVDLGGEGRGASTDENVFAIQTPVAVVTLFRRGKSTTVPATVSYRRVTGTHHEKLQTLDGVLPPSEDADAWTELDVTPESRLVPVSGGLEWHEMPALTDLFPWQQPGAMLNRAWPVAPSRELLQERWNTFLSYTDGESRALAYVTPKSGRTIHTHVGGLTPLAELQPGTPSRPIVRYGYRSFDRQWTFQDPRLAKTESPPLWASLSDRQLFLSSMTTSAIGPGPALTVTTAVPDKHHFRGSFGGKDVIPLYRDNVVYRPNIVGGLLELLASEFGYGVAAEDFASYVYAVLAHPGYQERFAVELGTPGPRVPLTRDSALFAEARDLGRRLLWLQTFTERLRDSEAGLGKDLPAVAGLGWAKAVEAIPASPVDVSYDSADRSLRVGTGLVTGVSPEVWEFEVSGRRVLQRWLGARTHRGIGRSLSKPTPLDLIRPQVWVDEWNDELLDLIRVLQASVDLRQEQEDLLGRIVAGSRIPAAALPAPQPSERALPKQGHGH